MCDHTAAFRQQRGWRGGGAWLPVAVSRTGSELHTDTNVARAMDVVDVDVRSQRHGRSKKAPETSTSDPWVWTHTEGATN